MQERDFVEALINLNYDTLADLMRRYAPQLSLTVDNLANQAIRNANLMKALYVDFPYLHLDLDGASEAKAIDWRGTLNKIGDLAGGLAGLELPGLPDPSAPVAPEQLEPETNTISGVPSVLVYGLMAVAVVIALYFIIRK
jgi:hypothetical protein